MKYGLNDISQKAGSVVGVSVTSITVNDVSNELKLYIRKLGIFTYNIGAGSPPQLGGTKSYQETFVWRKITFLWSDSKNSGGTCSPCLPGSFTYDNSLQSLDHLIIELNQFYINH